MRLTEADRQLKLQRWSTLLQEYKDSGLSLRDWLHENNLTKDTYYYWRRQLKEEVLASSMPEFVEVSAYQPQALPLPVKPEAGLNFQATTPMATIRVNNVSIDISSNASSEFLQMLLEAVAHA